MFVLRPSTRHGQNSEGFSTNREFKTVNDGHNLKAIHSLVENKMALSTVNFLFPAKRSRKTDGHP